MRTRAVLAIVLVLSPGAAAAPAEDDPPRAPRLLEEALLEEDPAGLAEDAREEGDPVRGAALFHAPHLACARCHAPGEKGPPLGPDLARPAEPPTGARLVEDVLRPSARIREGFETVTVITGDGAAVTGLIAGEREDAVVLRSAAGDLEPVTIASGDIRERVRGAASLMPSGLASQLAGRSEFLDLLRYLIDISANGPGRARELDAAVSLLLPREVPSYEKDIDHAGMIASLDARSLRRGRAIFDAACRSCHGTEKEPGSLPGSLRFASGTFRNGSDPYSMYRTLTRGYGMMAPQRSLVPREKYDVIHYIREAYLRELNPKEYARVDEEYLRDLPAGSSRGPEPRRAAPWARMDHGNCLVHSYEVGSDGSNVVPKGIAVRVDPGPGGVARGRHWVLYDEDTLRVAAAWSGEGFIDWHGIQLDGRHEVHPRIAGRVELSNPPGPGWADPDGGGFDDPRPRGRDGRPYGPLPRRWARFRGIHFAGDRVVLSYTAGGTDVLEMPGLAGEPGRPVFTRSLRLGPRAKPLVLQVARDARARSALAEVEPGGAGPRAVVLGNVAAGLLDAPPGARWIDAGGGSLRLEVPAGGEPLDLLLWTARVEGADGVGALLAALAGSAREADLPALARGGPPRWPEVLETRAARGVEGGPFAADALVHPESNPWSARMRFTGLDFLEGGRLAVSSWDGDVWIVSGVDDPGGSLRWRRFASGLFQPLGLKVIGGEIHVACRDQIAILRDLDGDGEADFHECFNNDHQATEHFHEFAMGLETDAAGNLYYAKGARHAKRALVPHHGTLLRVTPDGARTEIVARGFRAPNGVCVEPDGTFLLSDQEGHWMPKNRINRVREGGFYGNMWGYHDVTDPSDAAMEPPIAWITNRFDRSPAELLRVRSAAWGPLDGALLSLSYGTGKVFIVLEQRSAGGPSQGGLCALPVPWFPTGIMRGRFRPADGHLYACGMFAWAGDREEPGGLYRVRATGKPFRVPVALEAREGALEIAFSEALDAASLGDPGSYEVRTWSLRRSASYGSEHHDEKRLPVARAGSGDGGRRVRLEIPGIEPTWCMEIRYSVRTIGGMAVEGVIHNTIHRLGP